MIPNPGEKYYKVKNLKTGEAYPFLAFSRQDAKEQAKRIWKDAPTEVKALDEESS